MLPLLIQGREGERKGKRQGKRRGGKGRGGEGRGGKGRQGRGGEGRERRGGKGEEGEGRPMIVHVQHMLLSKCTHTDRDQAWHSGPLYRYTHPAAYVHGTSSPDLSGGRARFWPSQWPSSAPQPETWPLQCQPSHAQPASDEAVVVLNSYTHAQDYISTKGLLCVVLHASSPYPSLATQLHNHNCTHP